ncbi:iron-containing alcohol dehydrogenase, partial [Bilophila wadsworthia]
MMKRIDYFIPTRIVFGAGRLKELATLSLPGKKALLCVTEDKLMEKLGIQQRVIELLGQNGVSVAVFDKVTPNPTRTGVMAAAALAKESGCDFVIGLGGGSSIDTAKAASIMMANPGDLWDYASAGSGGRKPVSGAFPVVAISTTAGTGTEADPYAVVTNEETN